MVITYHGLEFFKVSYGNLTVALNPFSKESAKEHGLKEVKFGANVVFSSLQHPDMNAIDQVTYGETVPFTVSGPGEYEFGDLTAHGFGTKTIYDGKERYNTIYLITLEGITMLFLGALSDEKLDPAVLGALPAIDILFAPVGGGDVLEGSAASALGVKLEARAIIPMHYDKQSLTAFLKEEGSDAKPMEKLTIKKKELLEMEGEIIVLSV